MLLIDVGFVPYATPQPTTQRSLHGPRLLHSCCTTAVPHAAIHHPAQHPPGEAAPHPLHAPSAHCTQHHTPSTPGARLTLKAAWMREAAHLLRSLACFSLSLLPFTVAWRAATLFARCCAEGDGEKGRTAGVGGVVVCRAPCLQAADH